MSCPFRRDWKSPRGRGEAEENVAHDALDVVCKFIELAYKTLLHARVHHMGVESTGFGANSMSLRNLAAAYLDAKSARAT